MRNANHARLEAAIVFACLPEEITFVKAVIIATLNKSSEWWSDEDVSALLPIYSEDAIQKLLLKAVSVAQQS